MAISLFLALRDGPVHLVGQPRVKFQRITSLRFSSSMTTAPGARCTRPFIPATSQFQKIKSPVMPHLSVMLVNFFSPGILRTVMSSLPLRYSMGGISTPRPADLHEGALRRLSRRC